VRQRSSAAHGETVRKRVEPGQALSRQPVSRRRLAPVGPRLRHRDLAAVPPAHTNTMSAPRRLAYSTSSCCPLSGWNGCVTTTNPKDHWMTRHYAASVRYRAAAAARPPSGCTPSGTAVPGNARCGPGRAGPGGWPLGPARSPATSPRARPVRPSGSAPSGTAPAGPG
jgi:hypothetical protein